MSDKEEKETEKNPSKDSKDSDSGDRDNAAWEKMGGLVRSIVKEELAGWQPQSPASEKTDEKTGDEKTKERKKGFLEDFFKGLT
jgi:hypothetical protein